MAFEIDIGFASVAGQKAHNEDFCAAMLPQNGPEEGWGAIAAIADGVSTGGMGKEAAQTTVTSLVRDYYGTPETWDTTVALDRIIAAQNAWLCGINKRRHPVLGLTTLTALVLRGQTYTLAHVGDTRAYLLRDEKWRADELAGSEPSATPPKQPAQRKSLARLTQDHVVHHPDFQHQLLRSVGAEDHVVVDYMQGDLQVGDVFVLLSDGVHGSLRERQIADLAELAGSVTPQQASQNLLAAALAAGSGDNVTAMVVHVKGLLGATLADARRDVQVMPIPPRLRVGDGIDGLAVTATVADNGINVLYQVRESKTRSLYALKTLNPARAHDVEERAMLAHEAWLAKRMQSGRAGDHLVAVHEALPSGRERSAFYLLYDWHGGETLQQQLDRGHKFNLQQALAMATQTARTLGQLHRQGVIHRDVKPANLHQGEDGVLRLLDLGVALSGREPESQRLLHAGTPNYVNPEQWGFSAVAPEGPKEPADEQSDLFALGVSLYQLLTGKLPYGEVLPQQVGRFYRDPIAPSRHNPEVPIWLDHIVQKAVARDKRKRFETAEEMLLALERGASRPLAAPHTTPLIQRDPSTIWKIGLAISALFNILLASLLLFFPK